jgi:hypothetical protein
MHGGPITSVNELERFVKSHKDNEAKKFLRQEIQFQKTMHTRDIQERADLYKINCLSVES